MNIVMNQMWVIGLAVVCGLILGASALSIFSLWRAHVLLKELNRRTDRRADENGAMAQSIEALAARLQDLERAPAPVPVAVPVPAIPRAGMNLNKRSQALRLHRQGQGPDQIAAALDLPRQEVELLLKVHQIVLSNVT